MNVTNKYFQCTVVSHTYEFYPMKKTITWSNMLYGLLLHGNEINLENYKQSAMENVRT